MLSIIVTFHDSRLRTSATFVVQWTWCVTVPTILPDRLLPCVLGCIFPCSGSKAVYQVNQDPIRSIVTTEGYGNGIEFGAVGRYLYLSSPFISNICDRWCTLQMHNLPWRMCIRNSCLPFSRVDPPTHRTQCTRQKLVASSSFYGFRSYVSEYPLLSLWF